MKKLLLASAIAALSVSAANAAPTIYGKAFLILDYASGDNDSSMVTTTTDAAGTTNIQRSDNVGTDSDSTQLNSKSSRIGFKGSEALTADTDVVYKLEYQIDVDGDGDVFKQRDTYLGLANDQYGTLLAGNLTTIDDNVDFADVLEGKNVAKNAGPSFDEPRAANAFAYVSPDYDGMQVLAMYGLDSDQDSGSLDNETQYGIAATYEMNEAMNIGASYIGHGENNHIRLSGNYTVSPMLTIGALYQNSDWDTDDNENAFVVSAEMATGTPWTAYAQLNMVDNVLGSSDDEAMGVGVGGKYKFTKAATGHLYAGYIDADTVVSDTVTTAGTTVNTVTTDSGDGFGIGAGLEYKF